MDKKYSYTREKLWQAVDVLATSDNSIQERLEMAANYLIRLHQPEQDLPEELRGEFEALMHELTREAATADEGNIKATTSKLTPEQGKALAQRILGIYTDLHGGI